MTQIPVLDVTNLLQTRTLNPAFTATEVDDPTDIGGTVAYPSALLFGPNGPSEDDGYQLGYGDCGPCSCLKDLARKQPTFLQKIMIRLPSGRVAVHLYDRAVRPQWYSISPLIAQAQCGMGPNNCTWFMLLEKALAIVLGNGQFNNITGASPFQVYTTLGLNTAGYSYQTYFADEDALTAALTQMTAQNQLWVVGTAGRTVIPNVVNDHYYSVRGLTSDGLIDMSNPWGRFYDIKAKKADFIGQFYPEVDIGTTPFAQ